MRHAHSAAVSLEKRDQANRAEKGILEAEPKFIELNLENYIDIFFFLMRRWRNKNRQKEHHFASRILGKFEGNLTGGKVTWSECINRMRLWKVFYAR